MRRSRSADTLWIGVVGAATGWVAVGKVQFKPQAGAGHSHQNLTAKDVTDSIVSSAMKEADDVRPWALPNARGRASTARVFPLKSGFLCAIV